MVIIHEGRGDSDMKEIEVEGHKKRRESSVANWKT